MSKIKLLPDKIVRTKNYKTNGSDFITISGRFYGDKFNFPRFFNTKENSILLEVKRIFIRHLVCYQTNRLTTQATNWYSITLLLLEYILWFYNSRQDNLKRKAEKTCSCYESDLHVLTVVFSNIPTYLLYPILQISSLITS